MAEAKTDKPRGVLATGHASGDTTHVARYVPSSDLAFFVEHYWTVRWNVPARIEVATLPHPSVHLVAERGHTRVLGVMTGRFTRSLEGCGRVFAIKFRPGAFQPFVGGAVSRFTDREILPEALFGTAGAALEDAMLRGDDDASIAACEAFLRAREPTRDPNVDEVNRVVAAVLADRTFTKVADVTTRLGVHLRTLQRLFDRYVGVSPKWVIQRYRLHEAAEKIGAGTAVSWAGLAVDLGYADQSHLIHDFKALTGMTPSEYARRAVTQAASTPSRR